jgi:replication factor C large subunit
MWILKHRPESLDGFLGKSAVQQARKWDGRPVIIYGATGTGKTLLARLIAAERGWDVVEVSNENMGEAEALANTGSLFGTKRLLLIEDVDSVRDIKAVGNLVEKTSNPIIMTTHDYSNRRLSTLKRKCGKLQLRRPLPASIAKYLKGVCDAEGVEVDKSVLESIAKNASGDLRAALTDLEMLAKGRDRVTSDDIEKLLPDRDRESDIYRALSTIFGGRDFKKVVGSTWDISEQPRDVLWWVDENTPRLYRDRESIGQAYGNLSRADVFMGRIMRRQYWGFLRYANVLMTAGVNASRPEKINFTQYMFPSYFAAMGRSKGLRNTEESIAGKLGPILHASTRVVKREYIPLYRLLLKKKKVTEEELQERYNLEDSEVEYLTT